MSRKQFYKYSVGFWNNNTLAQGCSVFVFRVDTLQELQSMITLFDRFNSPLVSKLEHITLYDANAFCTMESDADTSKLAILRQHGSTNDIYLRFMNGDHLPDIDMNLAYFIAERYAWLEQVSGPNVADYPAKVWEPKIPHEEDVYSSELTAYGSQAALAQVPDEFSWYHLSTFFYKDPANCGVFSFNELHKKTLLY